MQFILFFFGLVNAGVPVLERRPGHVDRADRSAAGQADRNSGLHVLRACTLGLRAPGGLSYRHTLVLGVAAGIGFTVALFFATASFPPGATLDEAKMGALLSFVAAPIAILLGRAMGLQAKRGAPAA